MTQAQPLPGTKDRLLDAAEELFAELGYEATSLRAVTQAAVVNLAAVNYHFGGKQGLFRAVFERGVGPLNAERLRQLDALEARRAASAVATADSPIASIEELLEAFLGPALDHLGRGPAGARFLRMVGRMASDSGEHAEAIRDIFREVERRFLPHFVRALPHLSEREIFWRVFFTMGAMRQTLADPHHVRSATRGVCDPSDREDYQAQLLSFAAAGLRAAPPARRRP